MNSLPAAQWLDLVTYLLPNDLPVEIVDAASLPSEWISYPPSSITVNVGQDWAIRQEAVGLVVPSIIFPDCDDKNVLLNPRHPDFPKVVIQDVSSFPKDPRLQRYFPDPDGN